MSSKTQIVLVPGAWHDPSSFDPTTKLLQAAGYTVHSKPMPSIGSADPPKDLSADVATLNGMVDAAIGDGNDVAVICHSWGGIVASSGLEGRGASERAAKGLKGGVVRVGYLAAFMTPKGVSLWDMLGGNPLPWFDVQPPYVYPKDANIFYNDLSDSEKQRHWATTKSQGLASMQTPAMAESWKTIPSSFLLCEDDLAIPMAGQEGIVQNAKSLGGEVEVTKIKASHSPFLSMPEETARWVRGVAGEKV